MLTRFSKKIMLLMVVMVLLVSISYPCGPNLPNRILEQGDDYVLKSPEGYFYNAIKNINDNLPSYFNQTNSADLALLKYKAKNSFKTDVVDLNDLSDVLRFFNTDETKLQQTLLRYKKTRKIITDFEDAKRDWQWKTSSRYSLYQYYHTYDANQIVRPNFNPPEIPEGLPGEFEDYLRGAIFYHLEQFDKAKAAWEKLLNRPAEQRKYRSTWAAYMIGRVLLDSKPQDAIKWFKVVRELADKGLKDNLGLASYSIGWEARAELNQKNYTRAIELYLAQMHTGDSMAYPSLQEVCSQVLRANAEFQREVAINPLARQIITNYILSRTTYYAPSPDEMTQKWLKAIESANINIVEEAGRFAWTAYSAGDMHLAAQWLSKAPQDDIMAQWIAAKLLLQQGKISEATKQLVRVARIISPTEEMNEYQKYDEGRRWNEPGEPEIKIIRGELGSLYISQRQYIESLDSLIRGGFWEDAAYVAERILTIDELKAYIDQTWDKVSEEDATQEMSLPQRLRYLLARRLARLGRDENARPYYPLKWQNRLDAYVHAIEDGNQQKLSKNKRAASLWKAAVIARYEGMELLGTELEPDWFIYDGSPYGRKPMPDVRVGKLSEKITPSTTEEIQRTKQTIPPDKRFHYRYIAIQYAWQAAELMPDNSDQTARVLCIAGLWLNAMNDSQAADKFYKTLVKRCRKTSLGQKADEIHWFPSIKIDSASLLKEVE
jgi:hypothetical protein